ncbi:MAG: 50S ribosomal protein L30e [Candidatus Bathyarchaeota archaeon]|nr:MAG: 50S ribosomal protein L30e [Candidatus Bathyarchaeota archaeon]
MDISKAIATAVRTGKVLFGVSNATTSAKTGKAKLFILAANCPTSIREDIEYYCKFSGLPLIFHSGTSIDLGAACGKPFTVSVVTIKEPGDSDILKLAEAANV